MLDALRALGCGVEERPGSVRIDGLGGQLRQTRAELFLGNAGTAMRPLTAALALLAATQHGSFDLRGVARMHERPIGDLVDALRQLGCRIDYLGNEGFPPLRLHPDRLGLDAATPIRVRGDVSSQFLTALLLALPLVSDRWRAGDRGRRRTDLQAVHRDHAQAAAALRHRRRARRLAALHDSAAQRLPFAWRTACRGRCVVGVVLHRARRDRRGQRAAAHRRASAPTRSRATSASSRRRRPMGADVSQRRRAGSRSGAAHSRCDRSGSTATTSRTPP